LLERVARYAAQGYQRVKIKIQPGWDIEPVAAVRTRFPDLPLMVDANAAYSLADAAVFRKLDGQGLMMIEQPFAREAHVEAGELQRQLRTPLCADESAESLPALTSLVENGAARIINIKVQRVGGLSEARFMLAAARAAGLECWVGTMPDNIDDNGVPIAIAEHIGQICVVSTGRNQCFDTRLGCPNAICWSPDGSTFYVADSCDGWLYSYGFNLESATISERRPFFHVDGYGIPDGAAVDQDGYIWNARWGAGAVLRISPGGTIDLVVKTPTSQPTACCFGDSDRRTLYITSARFALSPHQLAAEPLAGGIFAVRTDVAGLELSRFGQTATVNLE